MRNLLTLLGFALMVFLVLGYFLDWYSFSTQPGDSGHISLQLDVNKKKIGDDVQHGVQAGSKKVHELIDGGSKGDAKK
jgi:hypothetical protein